MRGVHIEGLTLKGYTPSPNSPPLKHTSDQMKNINLFERGTKGESIRA
jgi:hypothetical protein